MMTDTVSSGIHATSGSAIAAVRWYLAAAFVFVILHFLLSPQVMPRGLDRPVLLIAAPWPVAASAAFIVAMAVAGFVATRLLGARDYLSGLEVVCVGVALWAAFGGTMDDWLIRYFHAPRGAAAGAYLLVLVEYVVVIVAFVAVLAGVVWAIGAGGPQGASWRDRVAAHWPPLERNEKAASGPLTALLVSFVAALAILVLMGPRVAHTYKGQVYFAVFVGFAVGTYAARSVLGRAAPLWYALAPVILGVVGMLIAVMNPRLPGEFSQLNVIPPNGLARPLPLEIISVGVFAVSWMMRNLQSTAVGRSN